jgi:dTDP-4-amino-4,6-dideoxygalactose transaminase
VQINFVKPFRAESEDRYISEVLKSGNSAGGGLHAKWCANWLKDRIGVKEAFLTSSATDALEMAALLLDISPGDEIIMPSFTFSSTANAFVLRGAIPVFIDVDPTTMNIDPNFLEPAITSRTKAVLVVHYAGASCNMRYVQEVCEKHQLLLIEDAAQALLSKYDGQYLGTFGDLACISFHATKNVVSGEGGALLINRDYLIERGKVLLEKGTNREKFISGEVDKYSWIDIGSSFLMSEITAAYLHAQLENADEITNRRISTWFDYNKYLVPGLSDQKIIFQEYSPEIEHNAHIYYLILPDEGFKMSFLSMMKESQIICASHYVPLHNSKAGLKFGRTGSSMVITESLSPKLVRLPLWSEAGLQIEEIVNSVISVIGQIKESNHG